MLCAQITCALILIQIDMSYLMNQRPMRMISWKSL
jgi:hypothetical protein